MSEDFRTNQQSTTIIKRIVVRDIVVNPSDYLEMSDEDFLAYVDEIVFQDIPIIESQRPELLPIDLQADVHAKPDATSIAYRRWLKELGLSTGTL